MRSTLGVLACLLVARLADGLKGGRPSRAGEHPYLVGIERNNLTWCVGVILDPTNVIMPDDCLRKSPIIEGFSADVVPLVNGKPPKKYQGRFVHKESNRFYTELDVVMLHLDPPGLRLAESNLQNAILPSRASISLEKPAPSDVIVVGRRRVAVMTILQDSDCYNKIGSLYFPMNDRLQSIKMMLGEKLMCLVRKNSTGSIEDIPPGQACPQDLGAPVVQNGSVVGIVARSFCLKYFPSVVLVRKLDSSNIPKEAILEESSTRSKESKNVEKRQSVEGKPKNLAAENMIQCHESLCEASVRNETVPEALPEEILRQERLELDSTEQRMSISYYKKVSSRANVITENHKIQLRRHRRDNVAAPAGAAAPVPGTNVTDAGSNGTAAGNITGPEAEANATGPVGIESNATGPVGPAGGNAPVPGDGNEAQPAVSIGNATAGGENATAGGGNATGDATDADSVGLAEGGHDDGDNDDEKLVTEIGAGTYKDTGEVILSGGDWDMGLERFGGSGNDTGGSGEVDVISGFGESAQDEIHESEEKLGPPGKPKKRPPKPVTSNKPVKPLITTEIQQEPEAVGPPEPNDDRPDYQPKPGKPAVRHAAFSPRNIPVKASFLIFSCFILSHINQ